VPGPVENGEQTLRSDLKTAFLRDLFLDGLRRRIVYISPSSRQRPEVVRSLLYEQDLSVPKNCRPYIYLWGSVSGLGRKNCSNLGPFDISLPGKDLARDLGYALVAFAVVIGGSEMATGLSERLQFSRPS
jgi:hypothetical protein